MALSTAIKDRVWQHPLFWKLNQRLVKYAYMFLTRRVSQDDILFLNFAYEEEPPMSLELEASDEPNRGCIQLYHSTASQVDLNGEKVLEVGCGHGGGASYIKRYLGPASYTGLDLNPTGIAFCQKRHRLPGLDFIQGDAQDLPFPDAPSDVVGGERRNPRSTHALTKPVSLMKWRACCALEGISSIPTANLPPVLPSGRPRSPRPRCGSFRSGTSMLRSCSGWRNIRSTGWTSLIAMRRHLCEAHSAKASPCLARGTIRAYKTGQPPTASTSSSRIECGVRPNPRLHPSCDPPRNV